ncbi:26S proteasome non-ATPase regulatory subunit 10-like [Haliotis rubra]|uniref:26S proteasome non-ATPase regulatory subunit 10-like n=1 Tax=Haliotis rubra TaxID=36100 RepID=UPI001EE546C4|nr:26S proteasome non-ATPase regulatory subunit 10-like [Haliotis rubra]
MPAGGNLTRVKRILSQGLVDINSRDVVAAGVIAKTPHMVVMVNEGGDNVLHWGCKGGHLGMVKYLLSLCSLDINSRWLGGGAPLMAAVLWRHTDVCEFLVSRGANVSQVDDGGNSVLHFASKVGQLDLMKSLLSQGSVDINRRGKYGRTPLMNAAYYGNRKMFHLLENTGGLTTLVDDQGHNILHLASLVGRREMVKLNLSQNMTDINARDKDGKTAAMTAKRIVSGQLLASLIAKEEKKENGDELYFVAQCRQQKRKIKARKKNVQSVNNYSRLSDAEQRDIGTTQANRQLSKSCDDAYIPDSNLVQFKQNSQIVAIQNNKAISSEIIRTIFAGPIYGGVFKINVGNSTGATASVTRSADPTSASEPKPKRRRICPVVFPNSSDDEYLHSIDQ